MRYRTLGSTGLKVSVVGVGTWQFGGEWGRAYVQRDADELFDAARDCGINLIDTAECYGDHESERLIGGAIERDRDRWIVASKFGHKFHRPFERSEPRSPRDVREQTEASLQALRTTWLDVQQYHSFGDSDFFAEDTLAELNKLRDEGKIRFLGNSVGSNRNVRQVEASQGMGLRTLQIIYNRLDRAPEETTFPVCRAQNLGVLARVPLASGFLSGKYKPGHVFDKGEVRGHWHKPEDRDRALAEVERIRAAEVPAGMDMASWALAWCLQHPAVTCVIPGCKDAAQVRSNAAAVAVPGMVRDDHPQAAK